MYHRNRSFGITTLSGTQLEFGTGLSGTIRESSLFYFIYFIRLPHLTLTFAALYRVRNTLNVRLFFSPPPVPQSDGILVYFAPGLHSSNIPVYAPAVINLIHERLSRPLFDPNSPPEADSVAWWSPHSGQRRPGGIEDQYGYSPSDEEDEERHGR